MQCFYFLRALRDRIQDEMSEDFATAAAETVPVTDDEDSADDEETWSDGMDEDEASSDDGVELVPKTDQERKWVRDVDQLI